MSDVTGTMPTPCRCECGYRCGGPGRCKLGIMECLNTDDGNHFVQDCGHDWSGPWVELPDGGSVSCKTCGMLASSHDMWCGP